MNVKNLAITAGVALLVAIVYDQVKARTGMGAK